MKASEFRKLIREEVRKTLNENQSPINHKVSGEQVVLQFRDEKECQEAKQYYSQVNVRTTPDKKGLLIPIESAVRFLVNNLQNKPYNVKTA
jgi:hypothetical protein